jgi:thymidylate synthase
MFNLSNVHIYGEHIEGAHELLDRTEKDFDKPLKFELKA